MANEETAVKVLGYPGRMISGSKGSYIKNNPDNLAVFNANICTIDGKIWYGDLDITKDIGKLKELAKKTILDIFVLREMDARFENENNPKISAAVMRVTPEGVVTLRADLAEQYTSDFKRRKK